MFQVDVPTTGREYLDQKLTDLKAELNNTTDPGYIKTNYRNHIQRLIDRIETSYDSDFALEINWIWNHLHELNLVGDFPINDFEHTPPHPIYEGFSTITDQFRTYVDVHSSINEINFPVTVYERLSTEIEKAKGTKAKNIDPSLSKLNAIVLFEEERALNTLKRAHRVSLTTYKDRIYLDALTLALSYTPNKENVQDDDRLEKIDKMVRELIKDSEYLRNGKPYFKNIDPVLQEEFTLGEESIRKLRREAGLTAQKWPF